MGILTPYPLAMVVCDFIWRDPFTTKKTLIGTFSVIGGTSFPLIHPSMDVYVSLTDGIGKCTVRLELADVNDEREPIFVLEQDVEFEDPRIVLEAVFQISGTTFPRPGEYRFKLFANQEFLIERRLILVNTTEGKSP